MERIHDLRFSADEGVSVASTIERHAGRGADEVGTTAIRRSLTRRDDCVDCSNWLRFRWRMSATSLFFFAWDQAEVGRPTIVITARPSSPSSFDSPPFRSSAISFGYSIRAIHLDGRTRRAPTPNFTVLSLPSTCTRHADNAWKWNKFQIKQLPLTWRRTEGKRGRGGGWWRSETKQMNSQKKRRRVFFRLRLTQFLRFFFGFPVGRTNPLARKAPFT